MNRTKIVRIIKEEISKKLKESRGEQFRRELDNAVNGTDYGYSSIKPGDDEATNRFKGLEIDDNDTQENDTQENDTLENGVEMEKRLYPNGQIEFIQYRNSDNNFHRKKGPALIRWYRKGQKAYEYFYVNGRLHRTDGPAQTAWEGDGQKSSEKFYVNGKLHRTDGPAATRWWENGQKSFEEFSVNGRLHRTDGPARTTWWRDGRKSSEEFYINGRSLTRQETDKIARDYLDLSEPTEEYKSTKNRKQPSDPRYAGLDLDGESEGMKPIDDKELETRGQGLDLDDAKNRPGKEDRFKPSIAGQRLTEKKVRLNKTKTRLILI